MAVRMIVIMVVVMTVVMMTMLLIVLAVMQALSRPRAARVFVEHQRFDGDRHCIGRHADAAEVDIVE
ncbi:MAG: hypothetical protein WA889_04610, partial [Xanthobacteraceae bacterium]